MNSSVVRTIATAQAVVGGVLAVRPDAASGIVGIRSRHVPPAWLVRVLGARMVAQAGLELVVPSPDVVLLGAAVDATHAASMAAVAALSGRYRRGAAVSGAIAGASALALLIARRAA